MCAIRLIRRDSNSQIYDQVIDVKNIDINPIDRPAYVVFACKNDHCGMEFIFTSDKEDRAKYQINDIYIEYGINSGRIYSLITENVEVNQTDTFHIINDSKTEISTERFKENIKNFIALCNEIIKFSRKNPV